MTLEDVLNSQEYQDRFQHPSPFYLENGSAYYRPKNIREQILGCQKRLLKTKLPKDVWFYTNSIAGMKARLKQAEWIEQRFGEQVFLGDG